MKAHLRYYAKTVIQGRYVIELSIFDVGKSAKYPDGVKYGLMCKDLATGEFVLFDNHHPKGPHVHISEHEVTYDYIDDRQLLEDFQMLVLNKLGVKL